MKALAFCGGFCFLHKAGKLKAPIFNKAWSMVDPISEIFLSIAPGLEDILAREAREKGFSVTAIAPGGVTLRGGWPEVWRANLQLRGAGRVLARLGTFRAVHLSQLDKRARDFSWASTFPKGAAIFVDTKCRKSKIYHAGAANERIENALRANGYQVGPDAPFQLRVRIDNNLVTLSLDTSGESLHKRGHRPALNKAPMRENMAAMFLRAAGFRGNEPLYDPMCGSGTFVIEGAEIARRFDPGRSRSFTFQQLENFKPDAFSAMASPARPASLMYYGSDRDAGAIALSCANADRAGVNDCVRFHAETVPNIAPPCVEPGLVITKPPYGARIGEKRSLFGLYAKFGNCMRDRFKGWRVAIITTDASFAKATGLPFQVPGPYVAHGGLRVRLWQTEPL